VPAKIIRYRFDEDTINLLQESKWWELEPTELYEFYEMISEPEKWARKIIEKRSRRN
jgi:hypothetical protein